MNDATNYTELPKENLISIINDQLSSIDEKNSIISDQQHEIAKLQNIITNANRRKYGKKSEKLVLEQEELFAFDTPAEEPESSSVAVKPHKRTIKRGRKPLPEDLERERIEYEPEAKECEHCGRELVRIGEEVTKELDYIPAKYLVREHVKIKCACPHCKQGVLSGVLPPSVQPLERSRPGAGLLTQITISKYVDHQPLFRQEQIFARDGIILSRRRMCDWIERTVELLNPLWKALKVEVLSHPYVQADETSIKVRDLELLKEEHKLFTGYFWAVHAPPNLAFFEYHDTRASDAAKEVLKSFKGVVQTDAYAGYNEVVLPDAVQRLACMAHIRRKFIDGRNFAPAEADQIIKQIAVLYKLEKQWKKLEAKNRQAKRAKIAKPLFEKLYETISAISARLLPKHGLQDALKYALKQQSQMELYLSDGSFHIDNNPIERQIRPIALGRKNYLFAGSHDGARRAAVLYSLLATCKLNGVNPRIWLTDVLKRLPAYPINQVAELLPHRWSEAD